MDITFRFCPVLYLIAFHYATMEFFFFFAVFHFTLQHFAAAQSILSTSATTAARSIMVHPSFKTSALAVSQSECDFVLKSWMRNFDPLQLFFFATRISPVLAGQNRFDLIAYQMQNSTRQAMHCRYVGGQIFEVETVNGAGWGTCVPKSCNTDDLAASAVEAIVEVLGPAVGLGRDAIQNLNKLAVWDDVEVDVAIVGFPRSATTALQHHLLFHPEAHQHNSVSFSISQTSYFAVRDGSEWVWSSEVASEMRGISACRSNNKLEVCHVRDDNNNTKFHPVVSSDFYFERICGWAHFPTEADVEIFNTKHQDFQRAKHLRGYGTSVTRGILIGAPDSMSSNFVMSKLLQMPKAKFIIQISDVIRHFDRQLSSLYKGLVQLPVDSRNWEIKCNATYDSDGLLEVESVSSCAPELFDHLINHPTEMHNLPSALKQLEPFAFDNVPLQDRMFLLHRDWLAHDSNSVMRSLESFLGIDENSLGPFPTALKMSALLTDICSSRLYESVKTRLEAQIHITADILRSQGHWVPPSLIHGSSACN